MAQNHMALRLNERKISLNGAIVGQPSWLPVLRASLPAERLGGRDAARTGRRDACRTLSESLSMAPMRVHSWRCSLSMNRPSPGLRPPSPRLAGRGQGEGCQAGSWSQCMRKNERGLSMNCPSPGLRPPSPRLAGRGQGEGCQAGSWSQCMRKNERGLSMNLVAADSLNPGQSLLVSLLHRSETVLKPDARNGTLGAMKTVDPSPASLGIFRSQRALGIFALIVLTSDSGLARELSNYAADMREDLTEK